TRGTTGPQGRRTEMTIRRPHGTTDRDDDQETARDDGEMPRHEREPQGRRDDGQRRGPKGPMTIRYRGNEGDEGRRSGGGKQTRRMRDGASTSGGETVSEYQREQTIRMRDEDEQDARTRGTRRRRTDTGQQTRRTRGSETDRARRTEDRAKRRSEGTAERRRVDATLLKNQHRLGRAVSPCSYKARLSPRPALPRSSVGRDSSSKLSHCRLARIGTSVAS